MRWSIVPTPSTAGGPHSLLIGLSCTSASACIAVGAETDSSGSPKGTLAERWNGAAWSIVPTPSTAGGPHSLLLHRGRCRDGQLRQPQGNPRGALERRGVEHPAHPELDRYVQVRSGGHRGRWVAAPRCDPGVATGAVDHRDRPVVAPFSTSICGRYVCPHQVFSPLSGGTTTDSTSASGTTVEPEPATSASGWGLVRAAVPGVVAQAVSRPSSLAALRTLWSKEARLDLVCLAVARQ